MTAAIRCPGCGDWLPVSAYRVRRCNRRLKAGVKVYFYLMPVCRACESDAAKVVYARERVERKRRRLPRGIEVANETARNERG